MLDIDGSKWMTVGKLIELLQELPPEARVAVNRVANLVIRGQDNEYITYVDFADESIGD